MKTSYLSFNTEDFLDYVVMREVAAYFDKDDSDTVEAEIHLAGLKMTHWIRWSEHKKKFKHEGIDGESEWLAFDEFLKLYPDNIIWHILK